MENLDKKRNKEYLEVGVRLRRVRSEEDWTQVKMAEKLDISVPMLQNYEAGRNLVSSNLLIQLANMKVDINWLLVGDVAPLYSTKKSNIINSEMLVELIEKLEMLIIAEKMSISARDKASLIARLIPKYSDVGKIDTDELCWLAQLANSNKEMPTK